MFLTVSFCLCCRLKRCSALTSQKYLPTTYQAAWGGCACPVLTWISCFRILEESNYQLFSTYRFNYQDKFTKTCTLYFSLKLCFLISKYLQNLKADLRKTEDSKCYKWKFWNFSFLISKMRNSSAISIF